MSDMQQAMTDALAPEESKELDRIERLKNIKPVYANEEAFEEAVARDTQELTDRGTFFSTAVKTFGRIVREQIDKRGTTDPEELKKIKKNSEEVDYFLYQEKSAAYRGLALCAWVLVIVHFLIEKRMSTYGGQKARRFLQKRIVELYGFLVDDREGEIGLFGRHYSFAPHVAELPEAQRTLSKIQNFIKRAKQNDRNRDREGLRHWAPLLESSSLSLEQIANGQAGQCMAFIERRRATEDSRSQVPGILIWESDGTVVKVFKAFGGVGRFVENQKHKLLDVAFELDWVCSDQSVKDRSIYVHGEDNFHRVLRMQELWVQCLASDQGQMQAHVTEIIGVKRSEPATSEEVPKPATAATTTASPAPEPASEPAPVPADTEAEMFGCLFSGCTHEPFASVQARNGHMASHPKK